MRPGLGASAKEMPRNASFPNFVQRVTIGGFCRPRSGWDIANKPGVAGMRREGARSADCRVRASEEFRRSASWRRTALGRRHAIHYSSHGCFAQHQLLECLTDRALSLPLGPSWRWIRTPRVRRGGGPRQVTNTCKARGPRRRPYVNVHWKEFLAPEHARSRWGDLARGKFVPVRTDNSAAAPFADSGSGRLPEFTVLARGIKFLGIGGAPHCG